MLQEIPVNGVFMKILNHLVNACDLLNASFHGYLSFFIIPCIYINIFPCYLTSSRIYVAVIYLETKGIYLTRTSL